MPLVSWISNKNRLALHRGTQFGETIYGLQVAGTGV